MIGVGYRYGVDIGDAYGETDRERKRERRMIINRVLTDGHESRVVGDCLLHSFIQSFIRWLICFVCLCVSVGRWVGYSHNYQIKAIPSIHTKRRNVACNVFSPMNTTRVRT